MQISSAHNPILQEIRRAVTAGRMTAEGLIVAEGPHLLDEALGGRWAIERIVATPEACARHSDLLSRSTAPLTTVSERAFHTIAATETTQGLLALLRPRDFSWPELLDGSRTMLLVVDGLQDPGNAGAIVRSAEAFGATGMVFLKGCVRVSNGKFLRATAGSILRMPFLETRAISEVTSVMLEERMPLYALSARGELPVTSANLAGPCAIAVGSEGAGISGELVHAAIQVRIPVRNIESLNAAVACSIALFEASRQRSQAEKASS